MNGEMAERLEATVSDCTKESNVNRYLIEVTHNPESDDCQRLANSMHRAGAHFVTHSDWGCDAGVHKSWLVIEARNDFEASLVVPPILRCNARVVRLSRYAADEEQVANHRTLQVAMN